MLLRIFSIMFPIFAIAGIGFLYGRYRRPDMSIANQLNMTIFIPALIFGALASQSFDLGTYKDLAIGGLLVVLGSGLLALPFVRWLNVDYRTFVPPIMFSNSGNMGLPLVLLAFGETAVAAGIVLFVVEMTLHFSVGAYILNHHTRLIHLFRMPMILATILGLTFSISDFSLLDPLETTIKMLGNISIPLLLFSLGVRLTDVSFNDWRLGLWTAILCPATGLAMVWLVSPLLNLPPQQHSILIIFGALPPAILNYIVAEQYRQEPEKVASIVMLANIGSLAIIPLALVISLH